MSEPKKDCLSCMDDYCFELGKPCDGECGDLYFPESLLEIPQDIMEG
jgi:hypothetical protein